MRGIHLPGGRGRLVGADAESVVGEQLRSRQAELPDEGGLYISAVPVMSGHKDVTLTADTFYLAPIEERTKNVTVKHVVGYISTAGPAGAHMHVGLYVLDPKDWSTFRLIPGTKCEKKCTSTGRGHKELSTATRVLHNQILYMGWLSNTAVAKFSGHISDGLAASAERAIKCYTKASTTELPSAVSVDGLTVDYTVNIPAIVWMSTPGYKVL